MTIIKKIENRKKSTTKPQRIHKLCDYITQPEKAAYVGARGFICDTYEAQKMEMIALAVDGVRSSNPISHYVISWATGETPTRDQVEGVITDLLHDFGMSDHQCIYGLHSDTDNRHLHVALNRVHPLTGRAVRINQGFDIKACHRLSDKLDRAHGWSRPPRLASFLIAEQLQQGLIQENAAQAAQHQLADADPAISQRALDYEQRTLEKSAERLAHEAAPVIREARSWKELHENLHAMGVTLERKGRGAVLQIGEAFVKASQAGKGCGFTELQKRLGEYEPPSRRLASLDKPRQRSDLTINSAPPGFRQYAVERKGFREQKKAENLQLRLAQANEKRKLIECQKEHRARELQGSWKGKGKMLNELRSKLATQHASERAKLHEKHSQERKGLKQRIGTFATFQDWQRGAMPPSSNTLQGPYDTPRKHNLPGYDARPGVRGTVNYFLSTGQLAFSDCGSVILARDIRTESVLGALHLAAQKWSTAEVRGDLPFHTLCSTLAMKHGLNISNPAHNPEKDLEKPKTKLETKERSQAKERQPDENKKDRTRKRGPGLEL